MLLMRRLVAALPVLLVVPILSGCAALSAKGKAPELPPMSVPPPPPRVIAPAPEPLPEPVADLPEAPPTATAPRGNPRTPAPRPQSESKPAEPKPAETAPPTPQEPAPVTQPQPAQPVAQLRTPQTADTSNAERSIRATLDRARGLLQNVDYRLLNAERKKAYDDAQRFIQQSEEKLKEGNLVFALSVANKAETLAKELAGK
jgi:outer membrane biosynthesis protein TonB